MSEAQQSTRSMLLEVLQRHCGRVNLMTGTLASRDAVRCCYSLLRHLSMASGDCVDRPALDLELIVILKLCQVLRYGCMRTTFSTGASMAW